ncbi:IclR family transcriptional regulator [Salibacterium aidingense]|uniref:IclR family transcriptional regulator n=1 Tax=Salibacterium aidingense TaxID=384933 RepID=UPI003BE01501
MAFDNKNNQFISSVYSSLSVLEYLASEENSESTLTEIAQSVSINKSTCLRILKTLELKDYVHFNTSSKKYKLGSYLIALGEKSKEVNDYLSTAISYLPVICNDISHFVNHMVVLAKPIDPYNLGYIAKEVPNEKIRLTISTGEIFPLVAGAVGKAFTAHLPEEKREAIIEDFLVDGKLPKFTERTTTNPVEFLNDLRSIEKEGIAVSNSEHTRGILAIACPIFDHSGNVILSVGLFIHDSIVNEQLNMSEIKSNLKKHADTITSKISRYV